MPSLNAVEFAAAAFAVTAVTVLAVAAVRAMRKSDRYRALWRDVCSILELTYSTDQLAEAMLNVVSRVLPAERHSLYIVDRHDPDTLVLRRTMETSRSSIRRAPHSNNWDPIVRPSLDVDLHRPLPTLETRQCAGEIIRIGTGSHRTIVAPLIDKNGTIVGAIRSSSGASPGAAKAAMPTLRALLPALGVLAGTIARTEKEKGEHRSKSGAAEGFAIAASHAFSPQLLMEAIVESVSLTAGAKGWLISRGGGAPNSMEYLHSGLPERAIEKLLSILPGSSVPGQSVSGTGGARYSITPMVFEGEPSSAILISFLSQQGQSGAAAFVFDEDRQVGPYVGRFLTTMTAQIGGLFDDVAVGPGLHRQYLNSLTTLVSAVESQSAFSRGHSERVARLAYEIALELGFSESIAESVHVAAYLRDVGTAALKSGLALGDGRFSQDDGEAHDLHVTLGAALVKPADNEGVIESTILHHHERYDGFGFPRGLKGDAIPIGARVVAAADAFHNLVMSTQHRTAIPFGAALDSIKATSSRRLDPTVVTALLSVFRKKRETPGRSGKTLEPCWAMLQCPRAVRDTCPAGGLDVLCWELPDTRCALLGADHRSCPVFTEYHDRLHGKRVVGSDLH